VTSVRVRAPASTANVGPGFDCAAIALELWNELEVTEGGGDIDLGHLGIRAFARLAPVEGLEFAFVDGIPRLRGLGSSAAVIALGLAAANEVAELGLDAEDLLAEGVELEGHADNLAAALAGGVCLTWDGRIARLADDAPAVPLALVPETTVSTAAAREALPETVRHGDASFTSGRATLLGAALASGSAELFAAALEDRLHEPYRAADAPLLAAVREEPPAGALGSTLSGSGPTVVVWARPESVEPCLEELEARFPDVAVLTLPVSPRGAHVL
jgi:homoserine kinase